MSKADGRRKKILVPVDFSPSSERALQYALAFAGEFNASLILLHVVEAFPIDYLLGFESSRQSTDWLIEQSRKRLKQLGRKLTPPGVITDEPIVNFGKPFQEIVRVAKDRGVDLIILATHGYTGLKHIELGSTSERVVRHAPCPVLVVREGGLGLSLARPAYGESAKVKTSGKAGGMES